MTTTQTITIPEAETIPVEGLSGWRIVVEYSDSGTVAPQRRISAHLHSPSKHASAHPALGYIHSEFDTYDLAELRDVEWVKRRPENVATMTQIKRDHLVASLTRLAESVTAFGAKAVGEERQRNRTARYLDAALLRTVDAAMERIFGPEEAAELREELIDSLSADQRKRWLEATGPTDPWDE